MSDVTIDPGLAAWLKKEALFTTTSDAAGVTRWGDRAIASEYIGPLAYLTPALREGARQLDFLSGPIAKDEHLIDGLHANLIGQIIALDGDRFGYEAGSVPVFVIRAQENETTDSTTLTVLYRLASAPRTRPLTLPYFDFSAGTMPTGATLKRASIGSRTNPAGLEVFEAVDVPRFDYAAGAARGLIVEPQETNTVKNSNVLSFSYNPQGATNAANSVISPTGAQDADEITFVGSTQNVFNLPGGDNVASGAVVTAYICLKWTARTVGTTLQIYAGQGSSTGGRAVQFAVTGAGFTTADPLASVEDLGNGWFRLGVQYTATAAVTPTVTLSGNVVVAPNKLAIWGHEERVSTLPAKSLIQTTGANVTRAADFLSFAWGAQGVPDGAYTFRVTFDDQSVQDVAMTVAGGVSTLPTNLSRPRVLRVALLR